MFLGRLPVVNFAAGGIATPSDAAMMMQLGMDGVFVGSVIFIYFSSFFFLSNFKILFSFFFNFEILNLNNKKGIFKSGDPVKRARAIVQAVTHYNNPKILAEISTGLGEAMVGINCSSIPENEKFEKRGW